MALFGKSRGEKKAAGKEGYLTQKLSTGKIHTKMTAPSISMGSKGPSESAVLMPEEEMKAREYRSPVLKGYMDHFNDQAYDHLRDWHEAAKEQPHVPIRKRKPFIRYNIAKVLSTRLASKLLGREVFPKISIEEDPESEMYFKEILKRSGLEHKLLGPARSLCVTGSMFVRFEIIMGQKFKLRAYNSNVCYPVFAPDDTLESVAVLYTYVDHDDLDKDGNPRKRWYKALFGQNVDILYDNPEFRADRDPEFLEVERVEHNFGFVQGEWFRTDEDDIASPDGMSLVADAITFQDALNYSLSQSQQATDYNTDPQLAFNKMDEDEIENLMRSSEKAWNLGREGEGKFLESSMNGVTTSMELRDKNRTLIQDLTRVILMDPEKMSALAQSGKALEVLHGPMVDLISELRPQIENHLVNLIIKIGVANIICAREFGRSPVPIPPGWMPMSANIVLSWPPVFQMTIEDLKNHLAWVVNASNNNVISRRTAVTTVQKHFNIQDVDAELHEINTQPQLNPFGAF